MEKIDESAIINRVRSLRKEFAGPRGKRKFAQALGISASTYSYYENDRLPPIPVLLRICQVTGADLEWLLTGVSSRERKQSVPGNRLSSVKGSQLVRVSAAIDEKLNDLLTTNPASAEAVLAFIELLTEKKTAEDRFSSKIAERKTGRPGWIPILGRTAAGGVHFWDETTLPSSQDVVVELDELVEKHIGKAILDSASAQMQVDLQSPALIKGLKADQVNLVQVGSQGPDDIAQFVECQQIYELFPDGFGLQIDGDSMSPRINDGDVVILSPSVPAAQGHIAIVRLAGQIGVTCKLIRTTGDEVHLIPINERYDTKVVPKDYLLWALAVLCHITT